MKTYQIEFAGREKGAIGAFQTYTETLQADSQAAAVLALYDKYDHVHRPTVKEIQK